MTQPSDRDEFLEPPVPNRSNNSSIWVWLTAALGCGCLGVILIGIIAAIALPSFLNSANKARESEAKSYVGMMTRAQQAYYIDNNKFSDSMEKLGTGIKPETENYRYQVLPQADNTKSVMIIGQPKKAGLKSYTGAAFIIKKGKDITTVSGTCESDRASFSPPAMPQFSSQAEKNIQCPAGSHLLN